MDKFNWVNQTGSLYQTEVLYQTSLLYQLTFTVSTQSLYQTGWYNLGGFPEKIYIKHDKFLHIAEFSKSSPKIFTKKWHKIQNNNGQTDSMMYEAWCMKQM